MCDVMTAIGTAGSVVGGLAQKGQMDAQAKQAQAAGAFNAARIREQGHDVMGRMRAAIGKSGLQNEGSPLDALAQSAGDIELDATAAEHQGRVQAATYKAAGKGAMWGGVFGAGKVLAGSEFGTDAGNWFKKQFASGDGKPVSTWQSSPGSRGAYGRLGPI